jgi:hypothetical protein
VSKLVEHAKVELDAIGAFGEGDFYGGATGKAVLELVEVFAKQGHSGMSASIVLGLFGKVANWEPLAPLTGEDAEWCEVSEGVFQNKRCSHVFRQADRFDGQAYDIEGRIFRDPDGSTWTNHDSFVPVTFPYTPQREYVDRPLEANE